MKTQKFWLGAALTVASFALATVLMSSSSVGNAKFQQTIKISGNATGKDVVPAVTGTGTATINGTYDPSTGVLTYTTNWKDLSGAPINGGFYLGAPGAAGTPLGDPWTLGTDLKNTGSYAGTIKLTPEQAKQLTSGQLYYTLGTQTNAGGEIRGQISAKP
jgi:hypothetical protein